MTNRRIKVAVALSGGVDSAVSAALLVGQGFEVTGIFMKTYEPEDSYSKDCTWKEDQGMAQSVAKHLGIPFLTWNFERQYADTVLAYFFSELKQGNTPNPDVMCNQDIKFGYFLQKALKEGFDYVATGHYAQLTCGTKQIYELRRGADTAKDQSYFLCRVLPSSFQHILFPIGNMQKSDVRSKARAFHLPNAERKDSQGICFLGKIDVKTFIKSNTQQKRGDIQTLDGKKIGTHDGYALYTIGQRAGLGIGGSRDPYYVVDKNTSTNTIIVAEGRNHPALYSRTCIISQLAWLCQPKVFNGLYSVQIRYQQPPQLASIKKISQNTFEISFQKPQWGVTPGQLCAIYNDNQCLASGIILKRVA